MGTEGNYEKNFNRLEEISESLNRDEIGVDDMVAKTKEALKAAKTCLDILNKQRGEFKKLESEFSKLLESEPDESSEKSNKTGGDDPF